MELRFLRGGYPGCANPYLWTGGLIDTLRCAHKKRTFRVCSYMNLCFFSHGGGVRKSPRAALSAGAAVPENTLANRVSSQVFV